MVPFSFANHEFLASPDGALFWRAERALLVADLHFEKASWFARLGQMLPPYDSIATLEALTPGAPLATWRAAALPGFTASVTASTTASAATGFPIGRGRF